MRSNNEITEKYFKQKFQKPDENRQAVFMYRLLLRRLKHSLEKDFELKDSYPYRMFSLLYLSVLFFKREQYDFDEDILARAPHLAYDFDHTHTHTHTLALDHDFALVLTRINTNIIASSVYNRNVFDDEIKFLLKLEESEL